MNQKEIEEWIIWGASIVAPYIARWLADDGEEKALRNTDGQRTQRTLHEILDAKKEQGP